ncbi:MAG TPA: flavodoxin family protein [Longilinea sp.]|nr:flavodoxin family protein [Longilinea sp.]
MKVTLLNGNPDRSNTGFDRYLTTLADQLEQKGHTTDVIALRDLKIHYCTGCFGCWLKTPGECLLKDEGEIVLRSVINSDVTVWTSPVVMGFVSGLLKKTTDRFLPLIHPYMRFVQEEIHHRKRYDRYPKLALLLQESPHNDARDVEIISDIYSRTALNFMSSLCFTRTMAAPVEEVCNEISVL